MSETISCPNCGNGLPNNASFCTNCGTRLTPADPPAPDPVVDPGHDQTTVTDPGLHDRTQVLPPEPPPTPAPAPPPPTAPTTAPAAPAPSAPDPGAAPWQPSPAPQAPPPQPATWAPPPTAAPPPPATWSSPPTAPAPGPPLAPGDAPAWMATGTQQSGPPATRTAGTQPSPLGAVVAAIGAVLAIVGVFTPWVTNNQTDAGLSGWDLTSGDKGFVLTGGGLLTFKSADPYLVLLLGLVGLIAAVVLLMGRARSVGRVVSVVVGLLIVGLVFRDWTSMADVVSTRAPSSFEISSSTGLYLCIAGGALLVVAAIMPAKKQS